MGQIIKLKCESDNPTFDQRIIEVRLIEENSFAYKAFPIANPLCPMLDFPKFAWKKVA